MDTIRYYYNNTDYISLIQYIRNNLILLQYKSNSFKIKCLKVCRVLTKRDELSFLYVFALPKAERKRK